MRNVVCQMGMSSLVMAVGDWEIRTSCPKEQAEKEPNYMSLKEKSISFHVSRGLMSWKRVRTRTLTLSLNSEVQRVKTFNFTSSGILWGGSVKVPNKETLQQEVQEFTDHVPPVQRENPGKIWECLVRREERKLRVASGIRKKDE